MAKRHYDIATAGGDWSEIPDGWYGIVIEMRGGGKLVGIFPTLTWAKHFARSL